MIWVLVAIIVIAIYNAERLPHLMNKIKDEVPHLVEAGKKAAGSILAMKAKIMEKLSDTALSVDEIAREINLENEKEIVFKLLIHLASNPSTGVVSSGAGFDKKFIKIK